MYKILGFCTAKAYLLNSLFFLTRFNIMIWSSLLVGQTKAKTGKQMLWLKTTLTLLCTFSLSWKMEMNLPLALQTAFLCLPLQFVTSHLLSSTLYSSSLFLYYFSKNPAVLPGPCLYNNKPSLLPEMPFLFLLYKYLFMQEAFLDFL